MPDEQAEREAAADALIYSLEQVALACQDARLLVMEDNLEAVHRDLHGIVASLSLIHCGLLNLIEQDDVLVRKLN